LLRERAMPPANGRGRIADFPILPRIMKTTGGRRQSAAARRRLRKALLALAGALGYVAMLRYVLHLG